MTPDDEAARTIAHDLEEQERGARDGKTSAFSCPECGGVLWQMAGEPLARFSCHTGHDYTADMLVVAKSRALEQAIAEAILVLKEKAMLLRQLALTAHPHPETAARMIEQAEQDDEHARLLDRYLLDGGGSGVSSMDTTAEVMATLVRETHRPPDD